MIPLDNKGSVSLIIDSALSIIINSSTSLANKRVIKVALNVAPNAAINKAISLIIRYINI